MPTEYVESVADRVALAMRLMYGHPGTCMGIPVHGRAPQCMYGHPRLGRRSVAANNINDDKMAAHVRGRKAVLTENGGDATGKTGVMTQGACLTCESP